MGYAVDKLRAVNIKLSEIIGNIRVNYKLKRNK